ncbi:hypothetical protein R3P38DRAFT_2586737 [Favolaschia claudopus]|uniref:Uncharacterized protein n=1 Tax=Favolaschia claudopus TaxID=2862362 RepID=A0AAV9Z5H5_9AGAR
MPTKTQLAMLWPEPGPPLTTESPVRWPGISPESTAAVRDYLQRDFEQHHGFFNLVGAHNHTPFHLLVEWVLGGAPEHLTSIWDQHVALERPRFESPHPITEETFFDHLGDEQYYRAYLYFFCDLVLRKPVHAVVEEWIFGTRVNFGSGNAGMREDGMVNRLLAGFLHPLIYVGFGLEFSLPGLVAEGLAHTAVHHNASSTLVPRYLFDKPSVPRSIGSNPAGVHAFSILARIQRDSRYNNLGDTFKFDNIHMKYGEDVQRYAAEWITDSDMNSKEIAEKMKELIFCNVVIYAMGGWNEQMGFRHAEFVLMHLVTSSITMQSYMTTLTSTTSKSALLRAYFARSLAYWISRGRPLLRPRSFFTSPHPTSLPPPIPGPTPTPDTSSTFPKISTLGNITPNPWLQIIQSALVHPDDHLAKFQRTLAYYGTLYGGVKAGEFRGTELEGGEYVDGTLFVRTAGWTMLRMGRVREGEKSEYWASDPNFSVSFVSLTAS